MNKNKKAYMRTLEVFLVFFITFAFLMIMHASSNAGIKSVSPELRILSNYQEIPEFRKCVIENNVTCIEELIKDNIPKYYNYEIKINEITTVDKKNIYVDAIYVEGNYVRNYYWEE